VGPLFRRADRCRRLSGTPLPATVLLGILAACLLAGGCEKSEDRHRFGFRWLGRDVAAEVYLWDRTRTPTPRRLVANACDSVASVLDPTAPGSEIVRLAAAPPGTTAVSLLLSETLRLLLQPAAPGLPPLAGAPGWRHDPFRRTVVTRPGARPPDPLPLAGGLAVDLAVRGLIDTLGVSRAVVAIGGETFLLGTAPGGLPWRAAVTEPATGDTLGFLSLVNRAVSRRTLPGGDGRPGGRILVVGRRAARTALAAVALARLGGDGARDYLGETHLGAGVLLVLPETDAPSGWHLWVTEELRRRLVIRRRGVPVTTLRGWGRRRIDRPGPDRPRG